MTKAELNEILQAECRLVWANLCHAYPALGEMPIVRLNGSLTKTAGRAFQEERIVEFGTKFFTYSIAYYATMMRVIVPHELIHIADFDLFGESELQCGHGVNWCNMMRQYGLDANPKHNMVKVTRNHLNLR